jgi:DNA primase
MKFSPAFLDDIRARLPVSAIVSRKVSLKKRGREYVGLSPFNAEKTPSFTVNDQKGFYHCFSSGKHGDIFRFVMETEGLSFPEAVERLADQAGVAMPRPDPQAAQKEARRQTLYDVLELAAAFFETRLQSADGARARGYLDDRGVKPDSQKTFRLGYAPRDKYALKQYLADEDIKPDQMIAAGLLIAGEDINVPYDRFRDRVMFPITDNRGRVIAFGGRALDPDTPAKYLNSPETDLFHKGRTLYNLARAREAAHITGELIAVEGYLDVIALAQAGIGHVVAPLGTALTADQMGLMWRMAHEPVLCFDGDKAGTAAAYRAADTVLELLKPGYSLKFALLPDGQDPDDLIRAAGREGIDQALGAALNLVDLVWLRETEAGDWSTPERRAGLEARIGQVTGAVADTAIRRHYETALRGKLSDFWRGMDKRWPPARGRRSAPGRSEGGRPAGRRLRALAGAAPNRREALMIYCLLNHPALLEDYAEEFAAVEFAARDLDRLRREILEIAARASPLDKGRLRTELDKTGAGDDLDRLLRGLGAHKDWFCEPEAADRDAETGWLHMVALHRKSMTLQQQLKSAEQALADDASEENFAILLDVRHQLDTIEGTEVTVQGFGDASDRPAGQEL